MSNTELHDLLEKARGERSWRQYAMDANISPSAFTRFEKEGKAPGMKILQKITSEKAVPRGGVTYEDLMVAAGYQDRPQDQFPFMDSILPDIQIELGDNLQQVDRAQQRAAARAEKYKRELVEKQMSGTLFRIFAEKGWRTSLVMDPNYPESLICKLQLKVEGKPVDRWFIGFRPISPKFKEQIDENGNVTRRSYVKGTVRDFMFPYLFEKTQPGFKYSFVVNDREAFDTALRYKDALAFRGDLSVILLSEDMADVLDEVYLSNYQIGNHENEFFITGND